MVNVCSGFLLLSLLHSTDRILPLPAEKMTILVVAAVRVPVLSLPLLDTRLFVFLYTHRRPTEALIGKQAKHSGSVGEDGRTASPFLFLCFCHSRLSGFSLSKTTFSKRYFFGGRSQSRNTSHLSSLTFSYRYLTCAVFITSISCDSQYRQNCEI